ncbi:MAG TPA: TonB-dependent receptor [Gemmatimonadales bacterium]|nr:TonB-dependent receptor [Gemmatimonadales bacterium]
MRISRCFVGPLALALAAPLGLVAQQQTGSIRGTVSAETGTPLGNVGVTLVGTARTTATNARGEYRLTAPPGTHTVRARVIGYAAAERQVNVVAGETTTVNFQLAPSALALSGVTVIGSRTARTATETPVPVDVIAAEEMQQTGQTEVNQILTSLAPSFNASHQTIADGTDHINPASLRGLGPDQVLVLVNGKRRHAPALVHVNGTFGRGTVGVDLNAIPASAIDRIEVLRDGASAQYGSDAIAGVINIVLKRETDGIQASTTSGVTGEGDGAQVKTDLNAGFAIGERGFFSVTGEYLDRGATNRTEPWSGDIFPGITGTAATDAELATRGLTRRDFTMDVGQSDATVGMVFFNAALPLAGDAELYAFGGASRRNGRAGAFFRLPNQEAQSVLSIFSNGFVPRINTGIDDRSVGVGVRGATNGWDVDFSLTHGRNDFQFIIDNTVNASMGAASPTTFDAGRLGFAQSVGNLDLVRPLAATGLRSLALVLGAEFRVENYSIRAGDAASWQLGNGGDLAGVDFDTTAAGAPKAPGAQGFPGFRPANEVNRSRTSIAGYAGFETQLTDRLLIDVGGRYERYSDFGNTLTGKLATRFEVVPGVALRGAVSTGFRAPALHQVWFNNVSTQFVINTSTGELEARNVLTSNNPSRVTQAFGVPALQDERSVNLSAGITARPRDDLSITADVYRITLDDRIVITSQFSSTTAEPDPAIRARVAQLVAPFASQGVTGAQFFANAVDTRTTGLDLVVAYARPVGRGTLNLTASANLTQTEVMRVNLPQAMADSFAGSSIDTMRLRLLNREDRNRLEDALPHQKGTLSARYAGGRISALVRAAYYGEILYKAPSATNDERFGAKTLVDVDLGLELLRGTRLAVGGNNVFNTFPDKQKVPANINSGRFIYSRRVTQFGMNGGFYYARVALSL